MKNTSENSSRENNQLQGEKAAKKQKIQEISPMEEEVVQMKPEDLLTESGVPKGNISTRIAILNIDWESIGVNEIYRVVNVFIPAEHIKKVSLYKTKLGAKELALEEKEGPAVMNIEIIDETKELEVREYLKKKMKYFYAVVEISTEEAAKELYASVDGLEIEDTHNYIDARFIPETVDITDELVESTSKLSGEIRKIPINPLYSTKPQLKWDEDPVRERYLRDLFVKDIDLDIAGDLIDASDDEEKQLYYKKMMQTEEPVETEKTMEKKSPNYSAENEDVLAESCTEDLEEESSDVLLLGEDKRFSAENNPDFMVDRTHPAYIAKKKKTTQNKTTHNKTTQKK